MRGGSASAGDGTPSLLEHRRIGVHSSCRADDATTDGDSTRLAWRHGLVQLPSSAQSAHRTFRRHRERWHILLTLTLAAMPEDAEHRSDLNPRCARRRRLHIRATGGRTLPFTGDTLPDLPFRHATVSMVPLDIFARHIRPSVTYLFVRVQRVNRIPRVDHHQTTRQKPSKVPGQPDLLPVTDWASGSPELLNGSNRPFR